MSLKKNLSFTPSMNQTQVSQLDRARGINSQQFDRPVVRKEPWRIKTAINQLDDELTDRGEFDKYADSITNPELDSDSNEDSMALKEDKEGLGAKAGTEKSVSARNESFKNARAITEQAHKQARRKTNTAYDMARAARKAFDIFEKGGIEEDKAPEMLKIPTINPTPGNKKAKAKKGFTSAPAKISASSNVHTRIGGATTGGGSSTTGMAKPASVKPALTPRGQAAVSAVPAPTEKAVSSWDTKQAKLKQSKAPKMSAASMFASKPPGTSTGSAKPKAPSLDGQMTLSQDDCSIHGGDCPVDCSEKVSKALTTRSMGGSGANRFANTRGNSSLRDPINGHQPLRAPDAYRTVEMTKSCALHGSFFLSKSGTCMHCDFMKSNMCKCGMQMVKNYGGLMCPKGCK